MLGSVLELDILRCDPFQQVRYAVVVRCVGVVDRRLVDLDPQIQLRRRAGTAEGRRTNQKEQPE